MSDEQTPEQLPPWTIHAVAAPQPLPTNWRIARVGEWVELEIATPGGVTTLFFDAESARRFGSQMVDYGRRETGPKIQAATPQDVKEVNKHRGG